MTHELLCTSVSESSTMVHAPFRWERIGDAIDGDVMRLAGQLDGLEADLLQALTQSEDEAEFQQ